MNDQNGQERQNPFGDIFNPGFKELGDGQKGNRQRRGTEHHRAILEEHEIEGYPVDPGAEDHLGSDGDEEEKHRHRLHKDRKIEKNQKAKPDPGTAPEQGDHLIEIWTQNRGELNNLRASLFTPERIIS